ncbi:MAG: sulfate/molybdate ABC transporter ATP-binding protein [Candidatus Acidiferrales bacterium]|jgi:molybdate transport system permease protein
MALEVTIEKKVGDFRLAVEFTADGAPLGLLGPSGSGKTMTLRAIAGLDTPDSGRIVLHGCVLFDSEQRINVPPRERRIGLLFQHYALFPHLTVAENVAFGLGRLAEDERTRRTRQQLAAMRLEVLASRYPNSLSGGEQQRVALARALAIEPAALLLDEPFSALDTHLRSALERQLRDTLESFNGSTVFVSHNLEEAYRVCRQLVVLVRGQVAARGPKEEIFRHPPTLEVARLTGCKNFSRARHAADGSIEAIDWGCALQVTQRSVNSPAHVAIRAHHIRVRSANNAIPGPTHERRENTFPCWLAAITETPFRVTLDLRIGGPPANPGDFHIQAEVFKQEWEAFRFIPQPWQVQLPPESIFLLPD